MDDFVLELWEVVDKHAAAIPNEQVLMGLAIVIGRAAKLIDHINDAAPYEGLDVINASAHQVYDKAIVSPRQN